MSRDDFPEPIKKLLAERAAYLCSNPDCQRSTLGASLVDSTKSIKPGIAAHICAASEGGPRYDEKQTPEERSAASNGIWLCSWCATIIDKNNGIDYPASLLRSWKEAHEMRTFTALSSSSSDIGLTGWCEESSGKWNLLVKNPTMTPFYDCVVYGYKVEHCNKLIADIEVVFGTIPPRQTISDLIDYKHLSSNSFGHPLIELEYTDSENKNWRRDKFGKLVDIKSRRSFD